MKKLILLLGIVILPLFSVKSETTWIEKNIDGLMNIKTNVLNIKTVNETKTYFIYNVTHRSFGTAEVYEMPAIDNETEEPCLINVAKYTTDCVCVRIKYRDRNLSYKFYNFSF